VTGDREKKVAQYLTAALIASRDPVVLVLRDLL